VVAAALDGGTDPTEVAAAHPTASAAWAALAERALAAGEPVAAYAYARTGYHRGLDQLRRNGWKGFGPVPWAHRPNQGFLRALAALAKPPPRSGGRRGDPVPGLPLRLRPGGVGRARPGLTNL